MELPVGWPANARGERLAQWEENILLCCLLYSAARISTSAGRSAARVAFRRHRLSPRNSRIGAAMKIEELAATAIPNSIGHAKLATAGPPQSAIGSSARKAVAEVKRLRRKAWVMLRSMSCRTGN